MNKVVAFSGITLLVIAAGFFICRWFTPNRNFSKYDYLQQPQICSMKSQKMIEIRQVGDPNRNAGKVFRPLYSIFYHLRNNHIKAAAPRARWPLALDVPKNNWVGIYGLPVSESVKELPKQHNKISLKTCQYGTVAEILHIGPYSTEMRTIERLKNFIANNGYEIIGDHEEEYLKGPGFWPTNPKGYYTIIRYRVHRKGTK